MNTNPRDVAGKEKDTCQMGPQAQPRAPQVSQLFPTGPRPSLLRLCGRGLTFPTWFSISLSEVALAPHLFTPHP